MSFFSDQAAQFQQLANNIQTRIDTATPPLDATTRSSLEDQQSVLIEKAEAMITADIQATLNKLTIDRAGLAQCTANLNQAEKTAQTIGQVVDIATAGVALATAIASGSPGSILSALAGAQKAISAVLPKPSVATMPAPAATAPAQGNISTLAASADPSAPKGGD